MLPEDLEVNMKHNKILKTERKAISSGRSDEQHLKDLKRRRMLKLCKRALDISELTSFIPASAHLNTKVRRLMECNATRVCGGRVWEAGDGGGVVEGGGTGG